MPPRQRQRQRQKGQRRDQKSDLTQTRPWRRTEVEGKGRERKGTRCLSHRARLSPPRAPMPRKPSPSRRSLATRKRLNRRMSWTGASSNDDEIVPPGRWCRPRNWQVAVMAVAMAAMSGTVVAGGAPLVLVGGGARQWEGRPGTAGVGVAVEAEEGAGEVDLPDLGSLKLPSRMTTAGPGCTTEHL